MNRALFSGSSFADGEVLGVWVFSRLFLRACGQFQQLLLSARTNNRGNVRNQRQLRASLFRFARNFAGSELGLLRRKPQDGRSVE